MAIQKIPNSMKNTKASANYTYGDFWPSDKYDVLYIDDALFPVLERAAKHFGKLPRLRNYYATGSLTSKYLPQPSSSYDPNGKTFRSGGGSYHKHTTALDIEIPGVMAVDLARWFEKQDDVAGVGLYVTAKERYAQKHIHFDVKRSSATSPSARKSRTCWWVLTSGSKTPGHGGIATLFKKGHRSIAIYDIQQHLNATGYPCGTADGIFGAKTDAALKAWQKAHGLKADGIYGKDTNKAMKLFVW